MNWPLDRILSQAQWKINKQVTVSEFLCLDPTPQRKCKQIISRNLNYVPGQFLRARWVSQLNLFVWVDIIIEKY